MIKTFYRCFCIIGGTKFELDIPDIATAKEGFWINSESEYTNGSDAATWIPPSSVMCVDKEYREVL